MTIFYKAKFLVLSLFNIKYQISSVEFFSIGEKFQFKWIENNIPDYDDFLYGDGYLGASYEVKKIDLDEYLGDPENYGVSHLLSSQNSEYTEARLEEINKGAELSKSEVEDFALLPKMMFMDGLVTMV